LNVVPSSWLRILAGPQLFAICHFLSNISVTYQQKRTAMWRATELFLLLRFSHRLQESDRLNRYWHLVGLHEPRSSSIFSTIVYLFYLFIYLFIRQLPVHCRRSCCDNSSHTMTHTFGRNPLDGRSFRLPL
jgi:hypothetical protein